jgi:hypothetical protein
LVDNPTSSDQPAHRENPEISSHLQTTEERDDKFSPIAEIKIYRNCRLNVVVDAISSAESSSIGAKPSIKKTHDVDNMASMTASRTLPKLLFVTNEDQLGKNIGQTETTNLMSQLSTLGGSIIGDADTASVVTAAQKVHDSLKADPSLKGVVLVGGYDVIPAQLLDCLPSDLRKVLPQDVADADNFRVWSDDVYGDVDGNGIPELPVTRIPDGRSSQLVFAALNSNSSRHDATRFGIRNVQRPAADNVFNLLTGSSPMLQSGPIDLDKSPVFKLNADSAYMWLHGAFYDPSTFWGQDEISGQLIDAFNQKIPSQSGANVILAAACWGGLSIDTPAGRLQPGSPIAPNVPESSIALTFLMNGAIAFVGCTGSHYSPTGAPLHMAFWKALNNGSGPAEALLQAKLDFIRGMPHGNQGPALLAIEYKTYTEFTCLGIGW